MIVASTAHRLSSSAEKGCPVFSMQLAQHVDGRPRAAVRSCITDHSSEAAIGVVDSTGPRQVAASMIPAATVVAPAVAILLPARGCVVITASLANPMTSLPVIALMVAPAPIAWCPDIAASGRWNGFDTQWRWPNRRIDANRHTRLGWRCIYRTRASNGQRCGQQQVFSRTLHAYLRGHARMGDYSTATVAQSI